MKWQETEHKYSAIERTNQLLENELKSARMKYEHLFGEQTKMDLNTQETVLKLQSKIAEQRQIIQDLQVKNQENQLLQAEINLNNQLKPKKGPQELNSIRYEGCSNINGDLILERLSSLEEGLSNVKHLFTENVNQKQKQPPAQVKKNFSEEFEVGIKEVSSALEGVFQLREEVDRERKIKQNILQKTYEARLEELKKQIKRRC